MELFDEKYSFNIKLDLKLGTAGNGLWSNASKTVQHKKAKVSYFNTPDEGKYWCGELKVFFPKKSWNINKLGLIYTDRLWIKGLREELTKLGFSPKAIKQVDYSEQGMQGDDYVSLDAGPVFIKECQDIFNKKPKLSE